MAKKDPSGAAKLSQELKIELDNEWNKITKEFYNELYKNLPQFSGNAKKEMKIKSKRDGRELRVEISLPNYMWTVWKGREQFHYADKKMMRFPAWKWINGPANSGARYVKFKNGYYMGGTYSFRMVHFKVLGVEGTEKDFIQKSFDAVDWSKFSRGVITKLNNKRIYL